MKNFQGGVFFIDMLGVSALTNKQIEPKKGDFNAWDSKNTVSTSVSTYKEKEDEHHLSAKILLHFRKVLLDCVPKENSSTALVQYAQLSDSAFIWSKDIDKLLEIATCIMWGVSCKGVLCRAGLSYGNFMQIDKEAKRLGKFVIGSAVTNAVNNERSGKGARIFCDKKTYDKIGDIPAKLEHSRIELKNPLDGTSAYEYQWYHRPPCQHQTVDDIVRAEQLIDLYINFTLSPKFAWNARSEKGRLQLKCSIDAFSQALNDLLGEENFVPAWSLDKIKKTKRPQPIPNREGHKDSLAKKLKIRAKEILQKKLQMLS